MALSVKKKLKDIISRIRLVVFDFDGVFTDNFVWVDQRGRESLRFSRADGLGIEMLRKLRVDVRVLSTETNPIVSARCRKLKLVCTQGVADKERSLLRILKKKKLTLEQTAFVGNDINDRSCLKRVGLPIVVRDAHPDVVRLACYRTARKGGNGAVREVCDLFDKVLAA